MFRTFKMEVNKKVEGTNGNEYQKVGDVTVSYPDLSEFGIQAAVKKDDNGADAVDADGIVVYEDAKADWLMYSIVSAIKMGARNKLIPGTIELRDGAVIPANWEQLLAEGGNRGEALKIIAEAKKAFASYVNGLEKKPEVKQAYIMLFGNKQGLSLQPKHIKDKFADALMRFAEGLEEANLTRYSKYIQALEAECKAGDLVLE